tara:strand:+ start:260 stop:484 length:225 start_codon:yes stop_codon:yes gene_type:complete
MDNYNITERQVLKAAGKDKNKIMGVDFNSAGFIIWLKGKYEFGCNESGVTGFEFDSEYDLLALVKEDCLTIRLM